MPAVIDRYARNQDTRDFLWALERASRGEGTFLQVQAIVARAAELAITRHTGALPSGDWVCPGCGTDCAYFTNLDLSDEPPPAGALSVCGTCGALSRVNATRSGYEALTKRAFNQLPTALRKQLLQMQRSIQASAASREKHRMNLQ